MTARTPDHLFRDFLRNGDPEAFASLYDSVRPELLGLASRLSPNASYAEDLVQATFLGALESASRFKRGHKVMAWLVGILKNQARLMQWRESRKPEAERLTWPEVNDPSEQAAGHELQTSLSTALAKLGAVYEPIMRSHLRDELTAQEIAAQIHRPAGTVRTQIVRGTAMLRQLLPAGIATMLFVRLTPSLSAADVRAELVMRAGNGSVQRSWWTTSTLKSVVLAIGSAAGLAIAALFALDAANNTAPPLGGAPASAGSLAANSVAAGPPQQLTPATPERALATISDRATLEVTVDDGAASVAGVPVHIRAFGELRFGRAMRVTDGDGVARFADLVPGRYLVLPINTGAPREAAFLKLEPNKTRRQKVTVTDLLTVRGRAVDTDGFAVANAKVWLSDGSSQLGGLATVPFATSDAAGHFEIVTFERSRMNYLQVTAPGHRASRLIRIPITADHELTMAVSNGGGEVTGTVLDADGTACANMMVRATHHGQRSDLIAAGDANDLLSLGSFHTVREVRTDAQGRFAIDGFHVGQQVRISAWSPNHARSEQVVAVGSNTQLRMQPGATIRGRITANGKPAGIVEISTELEGREDRLRNSVSSDDSGEFVLSGLTPGQQVSLTAESSPDGAALGKAKANVMLSEAKVYEWNPTLIAGDLMAGTLRSEDGTPLADWRIGISAVNIREGRSYYTLKTDAAGRFSMRGLPKSNYTFAPRPRRGSDAVTFVATWPLQDDYQLVIDADRVERAIKSIKTRFLPQPAPKGLPTGTLDIEGLQANNNLWLAVFRPNGTRAYEDPHWDKQREIYTAQLQPGRYQLCVRSNPYWTSKPSISAQLIDFTIASGSPTTLKPDLQPGVRRTFRVVESSQHVGAEGAKAAIFDHGGRLVARADVPRWLDEMPPKFEATIALAPGHYRMQVTTALGQQGAIDFAIHDLTANESVLDLKVK